ncbi:hypothetical protein PAHAL_1G029500 [Panicum hallii]|uniref:Uncharacterized protein n=1 Tax=Panicum hallii TaxID=206008 RepID=A0A2T8KTS4_9POAL|nr:hypothetical protein PAHAL_1G029500 [Panicum hallii]
MLRTAMREKIFEYTGRKQPSPEWRRRLPELAKRLEEILYRKFPNKNDYCNMTRGQLSRICSLLLRLSAQNQQIQQNLQKAWETASSSGRMTPVKKFWHITFQNLTRTKTICNFEPLGSTPLSAAWMLNLSGSQHTQCVGKVAMTWMSPMRGGHHVLWQEGSTRGRRGRRRGGHSWHFQ